MPSYTAWQVTLENYVRSPYTFRLSLARRRATLLLLHDIWKLQHPQDMWWLPLLKCCNRQCWQIIVHGNRILWWRHLMKTFSAILAICAGNSPVPGEFPAQRPVTGSFDVFFDLRPNKLLSKQWWGCWFETPSRPLWRHCNESSLCRASSHDRFTIETEAYHIFASSVLGMRSPTWIYKSDIFNRCPCEIKKTQNEVCILPNWGLMALYEAI